MFESMLFKRRKHLFLVYASVAFFPVHSCGKLGRGGGAIFYHTKESPHESVDKVGIGTAGFGITERGLFKPQVWLFGCLTSVLLLSYSLVELFSVLLCCCWSALCFCLAVGWRIPDMSDSTDSGVSEAKVLDSGSPHFHFVPFFGLDGSLGLAILRGYPKKRHTHLGLWE